MNRKRCVLNLSCFCSVHALMAHSRRSIKCTLMGTCVVQAHSASGRWQPTLERRRHVTQKRCVHTFSMCFLFLHSRLTRQCSISVAALHMQYDCFS